MRAIFLGYCLIVVVGTTLFNAIEAGEGSSRSWHSGSSGYRGGGWSMGGHK
jgi:uncharacterized membrane protein YgcG